MSLRSDGKLVETLGGVSKVYAADDPAIVYTVSADDLRAIAGARELFAKREELERLIRDDATTAEKAMEACHELDAFDAEHPEILDGIYDKDGWPRFKDT